MLLRHGNIDVSRFDETGASKISRWYVSETFFLPTVSLKMLKVFWLEHVFFEACGFKETRKLNLLNTAHVDVDSYWQ